MPKENNERKEAMTYLAKEIINKPVPELISGARLEIKAMKCAAIIEVAKEDLLTDLVSEIMIEAQLSVKDSRQPDDYIDRMSDFLKSNKSFEGVMKALQAASTVMYEVIRDSAKKQK